MPGLTGLWQVGGKNNTTFAEMLRMDEEYLAKMSPLQDIVIIAKTPVALLEQLRESRTGENRKRRPATRNNTCRKPPETAFSTKR